ncbi:hypothetical protein MP638_003512 [Amoeboaphelidium occidentale]|nr:hypothetical protein MP638_003512 [Amoeboaphelidium occidentale]
MPKQLFDSDSEAEERTENVTIKVNDEYARRYAYNKERDELQKLEEKYKKKHDHKAGDLEDDSSSEEEEDIIKIDPATDAQILSTIAALRKKDPVVYDENYSFFDPNKLEEIKAEAKKELQWDESEDISATKEKPLYVKDYHRETLKQGRIPGAIEQSLTGEFVGPNNELSGLKTHAQEMEELRRGLKDAIHEAFDKDDAEDSEQVFKRKPKTAEDLKREDEEYREWLVKNIGKVSESAQEDLKKQWLEKKDQKAMDDQGEQFLLDYVFQKGWLNNNASSGDATDKKLTETLIDDEEDLEEFEKAEEFEEKFNFRFEEIEKTHGPGAQYNPDIVAPSRLFGITTHARALPESARKIDSTRSDKRKEREKRKQLEKQKQMEEINRLKNLKKKEVKRLVEKIEEWSKAEIDDKKRDLIIEDMADGEWDPEKYDKLMEKVFSEDYYDVKDKKKPVFSDDEEVEDVTTENSQNAYKQEEPAEEAPDEEPEDNNEAIKKEGERLKKLLEEVDNLNYEDVVGGVPTKFRYRPVDASSFGLEAEEILEADDSLLNEYISLKKLAPFRTRDKDVEWLKKWKKHSKKRKKEFKRKLEEQAKEAQSQQEEPQTKKRKSDSKDKNKKKKKDDGMNTSRLEAYGL